MAPRSTATKTELVPPVAVEAPEYEGFDMEDVDEETKHVVATIRGKQVGIEYYANRLSAYTLIKSVEISKEIGIEGIGVVSIVADVIKSWGLRRNGEPVEVTPEEVQKLPPDFLREIWRAIQEDSSPNAPTSAPSRGFSARGATTATSRGGTA